MELTTLSSTNHVELSPSDAGFQDRYVVQEIIKEMAKNRPIDTKGKKGFKGDSTTLSFDFNPWRSCRSSDSPFMFYFHLCSCGFILQTPNTFHLYSHNIGM